MNKIQTRSKFFRFLFQWLFWLPPIVLISSIMQEAHQISQDHAKII